MASDPVREMKKLMLQVQIKGVLEEIAMFESFKKDLKLNVQQTKINEAKLLKAKATLVKLQKELKAV